MENVIDTMPAEVTTMEGDVVMGEKEMSDIDWIKMTMGPEMQNAQATFTIVALMGALSSGLMTLRYTPTSTYTAAAAAFGNDMYKYIDIGYNYLNLCFWAIASIFQLLSLGGIATDINMMVWIIGGEVGFFATLIWMYAMWYYKMQAEAAITAAAGQEANGQIVLDHTKLAVAHVSSNEATVGMFLMAEEEAWMAAQWVQMSDEKRSMWEEGDEKEGDMEMDEEPAADEEVEDADPTVPTLFKVWKMIHF